jgi:hypothetical protein
MRKAGSPVENSSVVELKPRRGRPPSKRKELLSRINELQITVTAQQERLSRERKEAVATERALAQAQAANTLLRNEVQAENRALIQEVRSLAEELARLKIKHEAARAKWRKRRK